MDEADLSLFPLLEGAGEWDDELLLKAKQKLDHACSDVELWDLNFRCGTPGPTEVVYAYGLRGEDRRQALLVFVELVTPKELARAYYNHITSDSWRQRPEEPEWVEPFFTETKPQRIRLWATLHEIKISPRGRLPSRIVHAFEQDMTNEAERSIQSDLARRRPRSL